MMEKIGWRRLRAVSVPSILKKKSKPKEKRGNEDRRDLIGAVKIPTIADITSSRKSPSTGTTAMAETATPRKLTDEQKEARNRRLYLKVRLPSLREEMKDLRKESTDIADKLKGNAGPAQQKVMRERRIFLTQHLKALRSELATLRQEHKQLAAKPRP